MIILMIYLMLWVHAMHCIKRTSEQRMALLAFISKDEPFLALKQLEDLRDKFDSHLFRLVTLRNPWKIYPMSLQPIIKKIT